MKRITRREQRGSDKQGDAAAGWTTTLATCLFTSVVTAYQKFKRATVSPEVPVDDVGTDEGLNSLATSRVVLR